MSTRRIDPSKLDSQQIRYIEIENVDTETGRIRPQVIYALDAPSRARKLVRTGDVIVSTVRPERNAVGLIDETLDGCICSTGFCVLVPKLVPSEYVFCLLKSTWAVQQLVRKTSSSMYPAVSEADVLAIRVPRAVNKISKNISRMVKDAFLLQTQSTIELQTARMRLQKAFEEALQFGKTGQI